MTDDDETPIQTKPVETGVPSRKERFESAAIAYGQALASGDKVDLAMARRRLAEVAWAFAPQITMLLS